MKFSFLEPPDRRPFPEEVEAEAGFVFRWLHVPVDLFWELNVSDGRENKKRWQNPPVCIE